MEKHVLVVAMLAGLSSAAINAQVAAARPTLSVAFPKAVDRVETAKLYGRYLVHIGECAKVNLVNQRGEGVDSYFNGVDLMGEDEMLAGLKHRKLDIAQLSSGIVPVAVEGSAVVPFAIRGNSRTQQIGTYKVLLIVRADSPYRKPADLKGRKIAHTTPASNSGNLAPRAYFPQVGLTAEKDYEVVYSKGHERSIAGLQNGFWDAGAVASDQFDRMVAKSEIRASAFRLLWESTPFPASAFVFGSQVPKALQERVAKCSYQYRFPTETQKLLDGSDTFLSVDYEKHYAPVKFVLKTARTAGTAKGN
jgi:phosphonate transport system substrate-binding protein